MYMYAPPPNLPVPSSSTAVYRIQSIRLMEPSWPSSISLAVFFTFMIRQLIGDTWMDAEKV